MPEALKTTARIILTAALLGSPLGASARPHLEPDGAAPASSVFRVAYPDVLRQVSLSYDAARSELSAALDPYSYSGKSASDAAELATQMSAELDRHGARKLWQVSAGGELVDAYYVHGADATVICSGHWSGGAHSQQVYLVPGQIGQSDPYPS